MTSRVRVAAVNDYELIVVGVAHLLSRYPQLLEVRDRIVIGDPIDGGPIDVALYDTYGRVGLAEPALRRLVADPDIGAVAVFSLDFPDQLVEDSRAAGVAGFISKALDGQEVAEAIVAIAAGESIFAVPTSAARVPGDLDWPGRDDGLSARQSQVLVLVAEGLTNPEIAAALYVSLETVKSHLREIFAKLGFRNRVEATSYVTRSGAFTSYQPATPVPLDHRDGDGRVAAP
jgi:DNA-binding NarL/FixJ family response regulator